MDYSSKYKYLSVDVRLSRYLDEYEYIVMYYPTNERLLHLISAHLYADSIIRSYNEEYILRQFNNHILKYSSILYRELLK